MTPDSEASAPPPRVFRAVEEVLTAVGEPLGPSRWREVSQRTVDRFAELTGDDQWIHVDRDRAAGSPYGGTIAHGYLTLALIPALSRDLYAIELGSARINYGLERVRFPAPLPVGARVRGTATLRRVRPVEAGVQLLVHWVLESDRGGRPVCVADALTLLVTDAATRDALRDAGARTDAPGPTPAPAPPRD